MASAVYWWNPAQHCGSPGGDCIEAAHISGFDRDGSCSNYRRADPGVIVGFCTNIINGFGDSVTIYYVSISVLLAIVAARFARKGYFSKFPHILLVILTLALIGGGIGSVLTWFLYGGQIGEGISSGLSYTLFGSGRFSLFFAQLVADFLIDLADKTITVLLVALIMRVLPVRAREVFPALKIDPAGRDEAVGEHRATRGLNLEKKS